jgi:hypothetical protein
VFVSGNAKSEIAVTWRHRECGFRRVIHHSTTDEL